MRDAPENLELTSLDIAEERRQELLRLFPEIRTGGRALDLERLELALGDAVDVGRERYGMTWPGKAECFRTSFEYTGQVDAEDGAKDPSLVGGGTPKLDRGVRVFKLDESCFTTAKVEGR